MAQLEAMELKRVDDVVVLPLLEEWQDLPEDVQTGLLWWHMIGVALERRSAGSLQAMSALYDVEITIVRTVPEIRDISLRVDNHVVASARDQAAGALHEGLVSAVAFCQFAYDIPAPE